MALAALGSVTGMLAGLLGLLAFGLGWPAALGLWFGGGALGLVAALTLAALPAARTPPRPVPQAA